MDDTYIFEPLKEYKSHYKDEFRHNTEEMFEELVSKSNINKDENISTVKKIDAYQLEINKYDKVIKKFELLKGFLSTIIMFLIIACGVVACIPNAKYIFSPDSDLNMFLLMGLSFMLVFTILYLLSLTIRKGDPKKTKVTKRVFNVIIILGSVYNIVVRFAMNDLKFLKTALIILIIITVILAIAELILKFVLLNSIISKNEKIKNEINEKRNKEIEEAYKQMAPLNSLYDWGIPASLIQKTIPIIKMDQILDANKAEYLYQKYGFKVGDNNTSTVFMQSGSILGNPFMICTDYKMRMINKQYTGSITISWTTTIRINGRTQTIPHVQVLTAHVTAPAPNYTYDSYLVYGNEAAPDLSFSRRPCPVSGKSEKEIKKYVEKMDKKLTKKGEKALMKGGTYQKLGNEEFEALFGGTDRDNEVQYRLLFTPLAQKNLLDLIKNKEPYGDDFSFNKNKCLNYIRSYHNKNYSQDPTRFIHYSYDTAKKIFIDYNTKFFESFYFELAPLMCIPIYQETKGKEYIYGEDLKCNFSMYEYEQVANSYNQNLLKHPQSITNNIYKTERIESVGNTDRIKVYAHSFRGEKRVTYCTKLGGDGKLHTIPVYWIEYFPVCNETELLISKANTTRNDYNIKSHSEKFQETIKNLVKGNGYKFERSLFSLILASSIAGEAIKDYNTSLDFDAMTVDNNLNLNKILEQELNETEASMQKEGSDALTEIQGDAKEVKEEEVAKVEEEKVEEDPDLADTEEDSK